MELTRRSMLVALSGLVLAPAKPKTFIELVNDGINPGWDGSIAGLESAYNTALLGGPAPDMMVVSLRMFAYLQYLGGHPDHGWFDFVKSDIRKRLSAPRLNPQRLPD